MSHQKMYAFCYCIVYDKIQSTSSKIVEQIEVNQKLVWTGTPKLNESALDKKQGNQTQFHLKRI